MPPCADPGFDHRTCDYWEDADRGSKASRAAWLEAAPAGPPQRPRPRPTRSPRTTPTTVVNPFAPAAAPGAGDQPVRRRDDDPLADNPFAPTRPARPVGRRRCAAQADAARPRPGACSAATPRCCSTATRPRPTPSSGRCRPIPGHSACATCTRNCPARRCRPSSPASRRPRPAAHRGHARALVDAVCDDLERRGFAAVEAYPERDTRPDATSAATPEFWLERRVPDRRSTTSGSRSSGASSTERRRRRTESRRTSRCYRPPDTAAAGGSRRWR